MSAKRDFEEMLKFSSKTKVDPDTLVLMGKRASKLYLDQGIPLNDAIIKIASEQPGLSVDHIQRVVENANLLTFERLFADSASKQIDFGLADSSEILEKMASKETEDDLSAFLTPPSIPQDPSLFSSSVKMASYEVPTEITLNRLYQQTKVGSEYLAREAEMADSFVESSINKLAHLSHKESREGTPIAHILELMGHASEDPVVFEKISSVISSSLRKESSNIGELSNLPPDTSHPIYTQYKIAEKLIQTAEKAKRASEELMDRHQEVKVAMKSLLK